MSDTLHPEAVILNAALELSAGARSAYLDKACAGDSALRLRIEELIQAHERAGSFLEAVPAGFDFKRTAVINNPLTEKPGDKIGRYKLLQQIGEGGCGVVYMAEQEEPVHRRVALKVIKLGMDTKQVIARFEAERQVLALMDHPNIAKVFDAGATETGRPYFVMELVRGVKITEFCDEQKVSTEDRLKLFIQVCQAIQHAHQKGIIHRDIKPSNILITINNGVPVPKVIDFGIAKATAGRLTDKTLFTAFEQFVGTPAYMSPEQAVMTSLDIDTRSDIYSLGVLLYELLTGSTPFDQKELLAAGLDEMRRIIRQEDPPKPSTRLSTMLDAERGTTASHRRIESPKLIHLVRGDLDWIVMKSLEKDRARRYETANGFAADVQRHLNNEPVNARPPSSFYRLQKAVRRNQLVFVASGAVLVVLILGLAVSTSLFYKERQAYGRAVAAERVQNRLRQEAEVRALLANAVMHGHDGRWEEAAADFSKARELDPGNEELSFDFAIVLLKAGHIGEYRQVCHRYLESAGVQREFRSADMAAKVSLLLPVEGADFQCACELADFAATEPDSSWHVTFVRLVKSLAEYRRGRLGPANDWARRVIEAKGVPPRHQAGAFFIQAAVCTRLGQFESARTAFKKGDKLIKPPDNVANGGFGDTWCDLAIADYLRNEAQSLMESQPGPTK